MSPRWEQTLEERFWEKVDKTGTCWNWVAFKDSDGYGKIKIGGLPRRAHRVSYVAAYGDIPDGMTVDHICHNTSCVSPEHLRLATQKQNNENRAGAQINSTSKVRGVSWHRECKKWQARVQHNGRFYHVGLFDTIEEAGAAAAAKRNQLFTHNAADRAA